VEPLPEPADLGSDPVTHGSVVRGATDPSHHAGQNGGGEPGSIDGLVVTCGRGSVRLLRVQPEGKAAMLAAAWRNGAGDVDRLGT
jgi:methionyl-tRNA formyltransferase